VYEGIESLMKDKLEGGGGGGGGQHVKIMEFDHEGRTYHAKGMWITTDDGNNNKDSGEISSTGGTAVTVVGSSNFDRRGYERDVESEVSSSSRSRK